MSEKAFIDCNKYLDENGPCVSYVEVWQAATLAERERCAKVCEAVAAQQVIYRAAHAAGQCAAAIRALPDRGT